jgi:hypothetical protein
VPTADGKAQDRTVEYITTYQGTYSFTDYDRFTSYTAGPAAPATQALDYDWTEVVRDVLTPHTHGRVGEYSYTNMDAHGGYQSDFAGGHPPSVTCTYSSNPYRSFRQRLLGSPYALGPPMGNPLLDYIWELPDQVGYLGLTSQGAYCPGKTESVLDETPVFVTLHTNNVDLDDAFVGTAEARYKDLPAMHKIQAVQKNSGMEQGPNGYSVDAARIDVDGTVSFAVLAHNPYNPNKIGTLFLDEAINIMTDGVGGPYSPSASGDPDPILIPGLPAGGINVNVTGTINAPGVASASTASRGPVLFTASAVEHHAEQPLVVKFKPTAAGHAALAGGHPVTHVQLHFRFHPAGAGHTVTRTTSTAIAARA